MLLLLLLHVIVVAVTCCFLINIVKTCVKRCCQILLLNLKHKSKQLTIARFNHSEKSALQTNDLVIQRSYHTAYDIP